MAPTSGRTVTAAVRQTSLAGHPFGVAPVGDGVHALVSLTGTRGPAVELMSTTGATTKSDGMVGLPSGVFAGGIAVSHDHRFVLVTDGGGTAVLDLSRLLHGGSSPVLGELGSDSGAGTIEVALSRDDRYAFVSDEDDATITVFDLAKAIQSGFAAPGVRVGDIPIGPTPVGLALSPNGRVLYAVNEGLRAAPGSLVAVDVARAERHPATAISQRVAAGCQPVRTVVSADGRTAWVAARGSDAVLGYDTAKLADAPKTALRSVTRVGAAPVGLLLVDNDRTLLVADSHRFSATAGPGSVGVLRTSGPTLAGTISAKSFPREFGYLSGRHEVLLTNYTSSTLETFPAP